MKLEKWEGGGQVRRNKRICPMACFTSIESPFRWNRKRMFRLQNGEIQDIVNIVSGEIVRGKFTAIYQSNTLRSIWDKRKGGRKGRKERNE